MTIQLSNIKYGYLDHERQEKILMDSNMDWTAIRPVALVNSKADKQVKVVLDSSPRPSLIISRRSVAVFTVGVLEKGEYIRMQPVIFGG